MNVQTLPPGYKTAPWTPPEKITGAMLAEATGKLIELLRIRTQPIGMRLFEDPAEMDKIQGVRKPTDGMYNGLVVSPLRSARLDPPDICLFYGSPGQMIYFINGLQFHRYRRYDFTCTGESACADSWGRALATRQTSLSLPCYAERRYGGVADDELLMACPPDEFLRAIEGMGHLGKNGLRYPFPPYGAAMDPSFGMAKSYG